MRLKFITQYYWNKVFNQSSFVLATRVKYVLISVPSRKRYCFFVPTIAKNKSFQGNLLQIGSYGGFCLAFLGFFEEKEETPEEKVLLFIKKGILAQQRGEYADAEKNFSMAFTYSHRYGLSDAITQVTSYQANLHLMKGNLALAEKLFIVLSQRLIAQNMVKPTDNSFVEASLKLAQIYNRTGRAKDAMTGVQYCVNTQLEKIESGENDEDTLLLGAWALHDLSQMYLGLHSSTSGNDIHLILAIKCLEKALKFVVQAVDADSEQALGIRCDMATAVALGGNYDKAIQMYNEISTIAKDKYEEMFPTIRIQVGTIYLQKGEFQTAGDICVEAKNFATKAQNKDILRRAEECIRKSVEARKEVATEIVNAASIQEPLLGQS